MSASGHVAWRQHLCSCRAGCHVRRSQPNVSSVQLRQISLLLLLGVVGMVVVVPLSTLLLLFGWRLLWRLLWQQLRWLWPPALSPPKALHDLIHQQARGHECIWGELLLHKPALGRINTQSAVHHVALGCRHLSTLQQQLQNEIFAPLIDIVSITGYIASNSSLTCCSCESAEYPAIRTLQRWRLPGPACPQGPAAAPAAVLPAAALRRLGVDPAQRLQQHPRPTLLWGRAHEHAQSAVSGTERAPQSIWADIKQVT